MLCVAGETPTDQSQVNTFQITINYGRRPAPAPAVSHQQGAQLWRLRVQPSRGEEQARPVRGQDRLGLPGGGRGAPGGRQGGWCHLEKIDAMSCQSESGTFLMVIMILQHEIETLDNDDSNQTQLRKSFFVFIV